MANEKIVDEKPQLTQKQIRMTVSALELLLAKQARMQQKEDDDKIKAILTENIYETQRLKNAFEALKEIK